MGKVGRIWPKLPFFGVSPREVRAKLGVMRTRGQERPYRKIPLLLACAAFVSAAFVVPVAAGPGHDAVNFTQPTYRVREGTSSFVVGVSRGTHGEGPGTADVTTYATPRGIPASTGSDYQSVTEEVNFQTCCEQDEASIPIVDNATEEVPETFAVKLENLSTGMVKAFPNEAVVTIVDNDGPSRVSFEFADNEVFENHRPTISSPTSVELRIVRSGNITAPANVHYATEPGSAEESDDFTAASGDLSFAANEWFKKITIPLKNDTAAEGDESFNVVLSAGAVASPSTAIVTIFDNDTEQTHDNIAPYTAFHQPLHQEKYEPQELENFLAFMQDDENGTGMDRVQLAIRMNRTDGTCRWWNGTRFGTRSCTKKRWAQTGPGTETSVDEFAETTMFTLGKRLKVSTKGSGIENYTAFCRGWDKAGNVQSKFVKGQNRNTFEVRGP